jgi:3-isopropylmalate/(R)-2-methylmalate dehydratase small subunit
VFVCPPAVAATETGDEVELDVEGNLVRNVTKQSEFAAEPLPDFVLEIARAGGLIPWVRARLGARDP